MTQNTLLEKLKETKISAIEKKAEKEKAGINYICKIIETNYDKYKSVFNVSCNESDMPDALYNSVEKTIKELEETYSPVMGIHMFSFQHNIKPTHPAVELRWAYFNDISAQKNKDIKKMEKEDKDYKLRLTPKGIEIVNGYREAQGQISLEEQLTINKENFENLLNYQKEHSDKK